MLIFVFEHLLQLWFLWQKIRQTCLQNGRQVLSYNSDGANKQWLVLSSANKAYT